jgi:hypothetical protein
MAGWRSFAYQPGNVVLRHRKPPPVPAAAFLGYGLDGIRFVSAVDFDLGQ